MTCAKCKTETREMHAVMGCAPDVPTCGTSRDATCTREHGTGVFDSPASDIMTHGYAGPVRVFVSDRSVGERAEALRHIRAYLYGGWSYVGWGSDPCGSMPGAGFLFDGPDDPNDGFGSNALVARLASGLHWAHRCEG